MRALPKCHRIKHRVIVCLQHEKRRLQLGHEVDVRQQAAERASHAAASSLHSGAYAPIASNMRFHAPPINSAFHYSGHPHAQQTPMPPHYVYPPPPPSYLPQSSFPPPPQPMQSMLLPPPPPTRMMRPPLSSSLQPASAHDMYNSFDVFQTPLYGQHLTRPPLFDQHPAQPPPLYGQQSAQPPFYDQHSARPPAEVIELD